MKNDVKSFDNLLEVVKKQAEDFNRKNIEQEKARHEIFLEKHQADSEKISDRHSNSVSQLITLEGAIFATIVVFSNPEESTIWLILSFCFILVSLIFGVWKQSIATQSDFQSHEWRYQQELRQHWWSRELWQDNTVIAEKELIEPHLKKREGNYDKTFTYKVLKLSHLTHDRIENMFKITFLISLLFLIFHFVSIPF